MLIMNNKKRTEITNGLIYASEGAKEAYETKVAMEALRTPVDKLEMLVDSSVWPIPTYGELMFEV